MSGRQDICTRHLVDRLLSPGRAVSFRSNGSEINDGYDNNRFFPTHSALPVVLALLSSARGPLVNRKTIAVDFDELFLRFWLHTRTLRAFCSRWLCRFVRIHTQPSILIDCQSD